MNNCIKVKTIPALEFIIFDCQCCGSILNLRWYRVTR